MKKSYLKNISEFIVPAVTLGFLGAVTGPFIDKGHPFTKLALALFCMGFTGSLFVLIFEKIFKPLFLKRHPFLTILVISTFIDTFIITISELVFVYLFGIRDDNSSFSDIILREDFLAGVIFFSILVVILQFLMLINTLIGKGVLLRVLLGKYHKPIEIERFFMFLDIKSSTTIAENIGHLQYLSLLNDFFYEVSDATKATRGEIYKYVGDEAIIVWTPSHGIKQANCLRCYFEIDSKIKNKSEYFLKTYGVIPTFKVGLHFGKVVAGELGDYRKEIAYIGDTVNTTARIESACSIFNRSLIFSEQVLSKLTIPTNISITPIGPTLLRGKEEEIILYSAELI